MLLCIFLSVLYFIVDVLQYHHSVLNHPHLPTMLYHRKVSVSPFSTQTQSPSSVCCPPRPPPPPLRRVLTQPSTYNTQQQKVSRVFHGKSRIERKPAEQHPNPTLWQAPRAKSNPATQHHGKTHSFAPHKNITYKVLIIPPGNLT